ncbi:DUF4376 domain-containing protein [Segnochrobactrum spirostomi]|uniref:DUF4376 domain-containing protein n=1 Tax=Segnochrobactrum spirostomi TaxID=2608987 RepID=A0A6A7Y3E0_9HYPH|nr:DUF4376 domain-containing protein [Segnochrobactrum spirostomi]MQT13630.1 DUF4376 domain-containing protein [Segnochrobactrum spirostomi]
MHLYRFTTVAERAAALDGLEDGARGAALEVDLVTARAVWGEPDPETGERAIVTPAVNIAGAWLLASGSIAGETPIAAIDPATMIATDCTEPSIAGARVEPMWSGSADAAITVSDGLAARRAALRLAVEARRDAILTGGWTVPDGPLTGHTLQTRGLEDRTNWLTAASGYAAMVAAGHGDEEGAAFRDAANVTVTVTFGEGHRVLLAMVAWGQAVLARSWALKDEVAAAADVVALDAIDITEGWPPAV